MTRTFYFTGLLILGLSASSFAQKTSRLSPEHPQKPVAQQIKQSAGDTLGFTHFFDGTTSLYYVPGGGYVAGNNLYGDKGKAQVFKLDSSLILQEVLLWFGAKEANSGNSNSKAKIYLRNFDSTGVAAGAVQATAPGTLIDSAEILVSQIDTSQFLAVSFTPGRIIYDDFAIEVDFSTLDAGDTLSLYTNSDGEAGVTQLAWELWNNDSWHSMLQAWNLDIDFAMWPVVDQSTSGIESTRFFQGIKLSQSAPNPSAGMTTIEYELQYFNKSVKLEIYDASGRKVYSANAGEQGVGRHQFTLDNRVFSSGAYYYSLKTDDGRLTKKMVISK